MQILRHGAVSYGEVRFYLHLRVHNEIRALALVSLYGPPDSTLLELSYGVMWSCVLQGDEGLQLVDVREIDSVVAMVPHPAQIIPCEGLVDVAGRLCVVEKPGLEVAQLGGVEEQVVDDDSENST